MNEDLLAGALSDWLTATDTPPPDPVRSRARAMAHARETSQTRLRLPAFTWWPVDRRSLVGLGALIAVISVLVLGLGALRPWTPTGDTAGGLAGSSPRSASSAGSIHWQTDVVDFRAEDYRLDVSDLTFTTVGAPLGVHSDPGSESYWTLELEWREHGVEQRMNWYFAADQDHWWVSEMRTYDGRSPGEWVYANGPFFRTPSGEAFEGDVRERLIGGGRPEDANDIVQADLAIDGLRLAVSPGERGARTGERPSGAQDRIVDVLRSTRRALFPLPERTPRPIGSPRPQWAVEFGGHTLTGELVDDGVLLVTGDGAGNWFSPIVSVDIAEDGTVWLARRKVVFALGQPEVYRTEDGGPERPIERIEANDDGSLTVHADGVWRLDRGTWSLQEAAALRRELRGFSQDGRQTVHFEDGSTWRTEASDREAGPDATPPSFALAILLEDGWQTFKPGAIFPATRAQYPDESILAETLLPTPSGDVWAYNRHALSRFDGQAWEETSADALADLAGGPVTVRDALVGPDGTLWVLVIGHDGETNPDTTQRLLRLEEGTWEVTRLEGVLPGSDGGATFYGLDSVDEDVWLMERDASNDYYVGPGGLTQVSRWTPRDAVEAPDGSVFGTAHPRNDGLLVIPTGEIRSVVRDGSD